MPPKRTKQPPKTEADLALSETEEEAPPAKPVTKRGAKPKAAAAAKKSAGRPATKRTPAKRAPAKKSSDDEDDDSKSSKGTGNRTFTIVSVEGTPVDEIEGLKGGTYRAKAPYPAAKRALSAISRSSLGDDDKCFTGEFTLRETTYDNVKDSKKKGNSYSYRGERTKLDNPTPVTKTDGKGKTTNIVFKYNTKVYSNRGKKAAATA